MTAYKGCGSCEYGIPHVKNTDICEDRWIWCMQNNSSGMANDCCSCYKEKENKMKKTCQYCQNCRHTYVSFNLIGNREEYYCEIYEENILANNHCDKYFRPISDNAGDCIHKLGCGYIHSAKCNDYQKCNDYKIREENMNSKELKMGDEVEVRVLYNNVGKTYEVWEKQTFIKHGHLGNILTVSPDSEVRFKDGYSFRTILWNYPDWRIPKEKTYRPFTFAERDQLRGKWIKGKNKNTECCIIVVNESGIYQGLNISFKTLYESYTFLDGSPCGVLEE